MSGSLGDPRVESRQWLYRVLEPDLELREILRQRGRGGTPERSPRETGRTQVTQGSRPWSLGRGRDTGLVFLLHKPRTHWR